MDRDAALAAFDAQMRRNLRANGAGERIDRVGNVVRHVAADDAGWSASVWSDLDAASTRRCSGAIMPGSTKRCSPSSRRHLLRRLRWWRWAGDLPVCSARVELHHGTEFASLWGGGTVPAFRGRGIYRALVAYRARLAAERGFRYVQVDASPESRPILERLGFVMLAVTTPYVRHVGGASVDAAW